ncbi:ATP-dependent helicase [Nocardia sp. NPDC056000]|uniref:ATP-dependent helicase n=1 Tax=Nocardia sp. NPDC056000 TaxID=3345674 RepID=UPI0035E2D2EE
MDRFSPATREWFDGAFPAPTAAQLGAWEAIAAGEHTLVIAPTGSGKTLSAFLWAIDRLATREITAAVEPADVKRTTRARKATSSAKSAKGASADGGAKAVAEKRKTSVLYISPLKALAVDVERNLRAPLVGVTQTAKRLGLDAPEIRVGVRSGDTSPADRRGLLRTPPDILITTPESLFLMLTSAARESLSEVHTVIVDEVHAIAGSKRGAHLALSLARLDALTERPAQRIGLSATVRPPEEVGRFLVGSAPITIVKPPAPKTFDLSVRVPVADMTEPDAGAEDSDQPGSIWPHVDEAIVDLVLEHRSSIVFANSRRLAERLTARLNEEYAGRIGEEVDTEHAPPAQLGASTEVIHGAAPLLARAHHGSVSKEQRAIIEDDLKSGRLRCVVATSSLELGIDMGAVELVVQVEAPPSVASGLQRVGRAGHQVGEISRGVIFPKHRTDVIHCAVASQRMTAGQIEELKVPLHPLDILAQQTVAACALEPLDAEVWFETVRGTGSYASLPRSAYDSVLDLLSGRYPSDEFAELRPRIVWDRDAGTLTGRPGAQRLAVTSGGAIPDRGLFPVFMVGEKASRVGELDEEMVYESRVGDVFALGATSWRIEEITFDRVLVTPAFGLPGRLPFWHGDSLGRPAELGAALGEFVRTAGKAVEQSSGTAVTADTARKNGSGRGTSASAGPVTTELERVTSAAGLDANATANLVALLEEQRVATGQLPTDRTMLVERFRDELGDWRVVLHSPYGLPVHAPWALAVGARLRERFGVDAAPTPSDDGIVVRLPDTTDDPPGAELFVFEPDEIDDLVTEQVGGSALFASRFRECAARALLLPRRDPGKRAPLWQQRQRAAQLLDVARKFPEFPILLETVRECLQDVYDLPSLRELLGRVARRQVRLVEVETATPSPFANSLLFDYIGQFMYEGDSPLAERRAAALSLDSSLLAELLGRVELRELLDAEVLEQTERELQRLTPERQARDMEGLADLLRLLGPITAEEAAERCLDDPRPWHAELVKSHRALEVSFAGSRWWVAVEDAARLRDALGVPLPIGVPAAFIEPVADPLGDLVGRYARTHGPFTLTQVAHRFGLGTAVAATALHRLAAEKRVVEGEFTPGAAGSEWCDSEVLRRLRRRSLAAARKEVEPVATAALARFLPSWQHIGTGELRGVDGVAAVVEQLAGVPIPASAWESLILPARVRDYSPAMLDELMATGEVLWSGHGSITAKDGWIALHPADQAGLTLPPPDDLDLTETHISLLLALGATVIGGPGTNGQARSNAKAGATTTSTGASPGTDAKSKADATSANRGSGDIGAAELEAEAAESSARGTGYQVVDMSGGGAYFFRQLADASGLEDEGAVLGALWELVWAGYVAGDTFAPVRALLAGTARTTTAHRTPRRAPRGRMYLPRTGVPVRTNPPSAAGRWSLLPERVADNTIRAHATADVLLERYGVLTRGSVQSEGIRGGFALMYRVLTEFEDRGRCRRGYFVDSLGGAQFSTTDVVDRLRSFETDRPRAFENSGPDVGGRGSGSSTMPGGNARETALVLAACDPANAYGAALPWPKSAVEGAGHRPGRKAGALVVLVNGELALYLERGGKTLLTFTEDAALRAAGAEALAGLVRERRVDSLVIDRVDGESVHGNTFAEFLTQAGFAATPKGFRLRSRP